MALKYIGDGTALSEVPARDLSDLEVAQFNTEELLESGLYQKFESKPSAAMFDNSVVKSAASKVDEQ